MSHKTYVRGPHPVHGHPMPRVSCRGKHKAREASNPLPLCHQPCDPDSTVSGNPGWQERVTESPVPDYEQRVTDGPPDQINVAEESTLGHLNEASIIQGWVGGGGNGLPPCPQGLHPRSLTMYHHLPYRKPGLTQIKSNCQNKVRSLRSIFKGLSLLHELPRFPKTPDSCPAHSITSARLSGKLHKSMKERQVNKNQPCSRKQKLPKGNDVSSTSLRIRPLLPSL